MLILTKDKVRYDRAQHIYTNESASPPPSGTQIFCGNLPRNMRELEIFPYFSLIGEIYEFRLMMEFSGFSRGFCFVTYMTAQEADQAVRCLHGYVLKDRQLAVYKSWDNTKLFMYGIPPTVSPTQIRDDLRSRFDGIIDVVCSKADAFSGFHKGWAFLEFDNHRNASLCRKKIWPNKLIAWGTTIKAEWARPARPANTREACTLMLYNVPMSFSRHDTYDLLKNYLKTPVLMQIDKPIGSSIAKLEFNTVNALNSGLKTLEGLSYKNIPIIARKYKSVNFLDPGVSSERDHGKFYNKKN